LHVSAVGDPVRLRASEDSTILICGMRASGHAEVDWKARAIEQWTADPCGPPVSGIFQLMEARRQYAPWMAQQLRYKDAAGLDILDVGCGQGIDVCEFGLAGARATGIDLTPRHVELARAHIREAGIDARVIQGDAEQLPFADASFDRVSSNGVLHHTPDIEAALREMQRVLRPGRRATIILYNRNSWHYWLETILWQGLVHRRLLRESVGDILSSTIERTSIGARPLVQVYRRHEVRGLLRRAGFDRVSTWVCPGRPDDSRFLRRLPAGLPLGFGEYVVGHGCAPDSSR
jgi:ubiquinone/menaquinone biosynthesis C-methylase UbiE